MGDDEPHLPGPVKDFPKPGKGKPARGPDKDPGKGPPEDFRLGDFRCLRCGAAFPTRKALDRHTEQGHAVKA